jgi:hypothetical protein
MNALTLTPEVARKILPAMHPAQLTGAELSAALDAGDILAAYIDLARAEAEKRLKEGQPVDGWEMATTSGRHAIPDTILAARQLAPILEPDQILGCAKLALGKVITAIQDAEGVSEKEAKEIAAEYLKVNLIKGAGGEKLKRTPKTVELHPSVRAVLKEAGELRAQEEREA